MTAMVRLPFDHAFATHLDNLGVSLGTTGTFETHRETVVEPPVALLGCNIWRDRAEIGAFTYFGPGGIFANATIGRYCSLAEGVQIGMTRHPSDWLTTSPLPYVADFMNFERHFANADLAWQRELPVQDFDLRPATTIGNDVWIGTGAYVKDGVTIGDGAIIGAHAVVTKDVPAYAVVVGSPARVLRYRFDDAMIARLQALRWWDYNILEFGGWDVRNVDGAAGALEDAIAAGIVHPYAPAPINLVDEYGRYVRVRAMLRQDAA